MGPAEVKKRAEAFRYDGLEVGASRLVGHYSLDGQGFTETVEFEGVGPIDDAATRVATLWYLVAGLSYYKAGAARRVELAGTPVGPAGRSLLAAALVDGLGEFAYRNDLDLADVTFSGGLPLVSAPFRHDPTRVLTPFGGGIDSIVTVSELSPEIDQALFVVSPPDGRFEPIEEAALVTGLEVRRATRTLDPRIRESDPSRFDGHVPVTAMITLLAVVAAIADGRGGVAMSNEHSASVPNLVHRGREVNHQWSKSLTAERLIAAAVEEAVGPEMCVASFLRNRSEPWVAQRFSGLPVYHSAFRSCNRAFAQDPARRSERWCGECDKCLFIHLVLAPFLDRANLAEFLGVEPLADPARRAQLEVLVGLSGESKPFECVGDPAECAASLVELARRPQWRDEPLVASLAPLLSPDESLEDLLEPRGVTCVPATWLR